jgi:hypothetical protein
MKVDFFDEFIHFANIGKTRMDEWNTKSLTTSERWAEILQFVQSECISLKKTTHFGILFCHSWY